jgi:hypothetical protein
MTFGTKSILHDDDLPICVAYLILAHGSPEQLLRLVQALPRNSPIFIHFDRRSDQALYSRAATLLGNRPKLEFVDRYTCRWGGIGIVEGTISAIRGLVRSKIDFDYAILLSGSDYPIKSNRQIARFLQERQGSEFIESFLLTERNRWSDQGGYFRAPDRFLARHIRFRSKVFRMPGLRRLPAGLKPYGGSQWWCLSNIAIRYIADFTDRNPQLLAFCRSSFIPDEAYIQTVISNSHFADHVVQDDLRVIIWDRPQPPYPATLTLDDLDMLSSSPKLFARKFDLNKCPEIYKALDELNAYLR